MFQNTIVESFQKNCKVSTIICMAFQNICSASEYKIRINSPLFLKLTCAKRRKNEQKYSALFPFIIVVDIEFEHILNSFFITTFKQLAF